MIEGPLEPTDKNPEIDKFLHKIQGRPRGGKGCTRCGSARMMPSDFRNAMSIKEAQISWMCQQCQDVMFNPKEKSNV